MYQTRGLVGWYTDRLLKSGVSLQEIADALDASYASVWQARLAPDLIWVPEAS